MKRKLSMTLAIILVTTSFISCNEQDSPQEVTPQEVTPQEVTPQEVTPQDITPQDIQNPSTEGVWEQNSLNDYTVVYDEDNEFFVQEEFEYIERDWDSISDYDVVINENNEYFTQEESEFIEPTTVPSSQAIEVPPTVAIIDPEEAALMPTPVSASHIYNNRNVVDLYLYDIENYTMAILETTINVGGITEDENASKVNLIINTLGDYTSTTPDKYAYFIITYDNNTNTYHKDYVFIDDSNQVLVDGIAYIQDYSLYLYPSWIMHMSQDNMSSANIIDTMGMNVTLNNEYLLGVLSNNLKYYLPVTSTNSVSNGNTLTIPTSNGSNFKKVTINFNNGVYYDLQISGDSLQIYTSDLDKTVNYSLDSIVGDKIHNILSGY